MHRILILGICTIFCFSTCSNKKTSQSTYDKVSKLEVRSAFLQEFVPGQQGSKPYMTLTLDLVNLNAVEDLKAVIGQDIIPLREYGGEFIGTCPKVYSFGKGELPKISIEYTWDDKDDYAVEVDNLQLKEAIYMP